MGDYGSVMALDSIAIGAEVRRADVVERYGGSMQGGIIPSNTSGTVMIYTDPDVGTGHGYNFDGWADGVFYYTGAGQEGDQVLTRANGAILNHVDEGRTLHVFEAVPGQGRKPVGGKLQRYCGEFQLDQNEPYRREDAPDKFGDLRSVVVFKLIPIGEVVASMSAGRADEPRRGSRATRESVESNDVRRFDRNGTGAHTAERREAGLMADLEDHIGKRLGHDVCRYKIELPDSSTTMWTDTFDATDGVLYELKAAATRENMRMAIGQLLDYARFIPDVCGRFVVMPVEPAADLVALAHSAGIGVTWPDGDSFAVHEAKGLA